MAKTFDIQRFQAPESNATQYERQLRRLRAAGKEIASIESAVNSAVENLKRNARSFVIYGEPQSGKTEMMICLTARLIDNGNSLIIHLLNDSVDLLGQNLGRFKQSGLAPTARNFSDILDASIRLDGQPHVIFCKKNGKDLGRLIEKLNGKDGVIVVDDEADYASPNAKVNSGGQTAVNAHIETILGKSGTYIGVTATPARLDLNNTFANDSNQWVNFPPHSKYTGQDAFFPIDGPIQYRRTLLSDAGADPKHARRALFSFLVNVSYLNQFVNKSEESYSILIHTSGKKIDHKSDWGVINKALQVLISRSGAEYERYAEQIWDLATERYPSVDADGLLHYILENVSRNAIVVLNSERDFKDGNASAATNPTSLFTIIIGGNLVSRGVTLKNLLSMFFTRDVKHKIQQDTYIQRARMFGSRESYLPYFELTIPASLYADWHRCFVFHRLALTAIRDGYGSLVWIADNRIAPVASASIDRSTVNLDRGEMSFSLFSYLESGVDLLLAEQMPSPAKLDKLADLLGPDCLPAFLVKFIQSTRVDGKASVHVHQPLDVKNFSDETGKVQRKRGFLGTNQLAKAPQGTRHHIFVLHNGKDMARVFYKYSESLQFIENLKRYDR